MGNPRLLPVGETAFGTGDTPMAEPLKDGAVTGGSKVCADGVRRGYGLPGRSGPAKGNVNAIRHGLTAGKLPPDCQYIERKVNGLRLTLEDAVMAAKGEIGLVDAATIQSVCKWERHGALALRWLTKEAANLKPVERLQFSREIARASTERDKSLAMLGLDKPVESEWAALSNTRPTDETEGGA